MRRAAKKDANHNDVAAGLQDLGWSVLDLSGVGNGCPDLAVAKGFTCALIEIKDGSKPPSARRLTPDQVAFRSRWDGPYLIVTSLEDALLQLACLIAGMKGET